MKNHIIGSFVKKIIRGIFSRSVFLQMIEKLLIAEDDLTNEKVLSQIIRQYLRLLKDTVFGLSLNDRLIAPIFLKIRYPCVLN